MTDNSDYFSISKGLAIIIGAAVFLIISIAAFQTYRYTHMLSRHEERFNVFQKQYQEQITSIHDKHNLEIKQVYTEYLEYIKGLYSQLPEPVIGNTKDKLDFSLPTTAPDYQ